MQASLPLTLRPATFASCELLWKWANEPTVREASFTSGIIPIETHRRWLTKRLGCKDYDIFVAVRADGHPVGVIRFEPDARGNLVVSISIRTTDRGKGYGSRIIRRACAMLRTRRRFKNFIADIKVGNVGSQVAFKRAGFRKSLSFRKGGAIVVRMVSK